MGEKYKIIENFEQVTDRYANNLNKRILAEIERRVKMEQRALTFTIQYFTRRKLDALGETPMDRELARHLIDFESELIRLLY